MLLGLNSPNTVKPEKIGFGMAIIARLRPVFCVFRPKIPRTFYFKLTEQSSRKKLAVGGFEPEKVRPLYPAPLKKPLLCGNMVCRAKDGKHWVKLWLVSAET